MDMQIIVGDEGDGNSAYLPPSSGNTFVADHASHGYSSPGLLETRQIIAGRSDVVVRNQFDATELAISREMEKKKIRKDFKARLLRRELELEVIREMITEGELVMRPSLDTLLRPESQGASVFDCLLPPESQVASVFDRRYGVGIGFEERPVGELRRQEGEIDGRFSLVAQPEGGVVDGLPFPHHPEAVSNGQVVSLDQPMIPSFAGTKRKLEALVTDGGNGIPPVVMSKQLQKLWSCDLCQINVTSEQLLKTHRYGRKHSRKEKELAAENGSLNVCMRPNRGRSQDRHREEMNVVEALDRGLQQPENLNKTNGGSKGRTNEQDFKFWCTRCNVGTPTEALMTAHRAGKEHMALLRENGGGVIVRRTLPDKVVCASIAKVAAADRMEELLGTADGEADIVGNYQLEDGELVTLSMNYGDLEELLTTC